MSNNTDNDAGLKLLQDVFKAAGTLNSHFPSFLDILDKAAKAVKEAEEKEEKEEKEMHKCERKCEHDCVPVCECDKQCDECETECVKPAKQGMTNVTFGDTYKFCMESSELIDGSITYSVVYTDIDPKIVDNDELFPLWFKQVYEKYFLWAYKNNIAAKNDREKVMTITFEFYAEGDIETNLALSPWNWDNEMRTFYYVDEEGDKHYVRYFNHDGDVIVCVKDNRIVTDKISDADRKMFINNIKNTIDDKMSPCDKKCDKECDKMSCDSENLCSGTKVDYNVDDIFDNMEENDKDEAYEGEPDESDCKNIGDITRAYGYEVSAQSVRDNNVKADYPAEVKRIYKDILYKQTNEESDRTEELLNLFAYMLDNKKYGHCFYKDKVVLSVCFEDMMQYVGDEFKKQEPDNFPWFMPSSNKLLPVTWDEVDKQLLADSIRCHYNFDEVIFVDMPFANDDLTKRHSILCIFNAM